jgi:hypothetical protein
MNAPRHFLVLVFLLAAAGCRPSPSGRSPQPQEPSPDVQLWRALGFAEDKDLSGIARISPTQALVCSDELRAVQTATIDSATSTITAGALITLLPDGIEGESECDLEGVAVAPEEPAYYVIGSHGVGKKKGDFQASRTHVFRIPIDPATRQPQAAGITVGSLRPWLEKDPVLSRYVGQPLQENGFNIEGLTYQTGKLWIGVRGPNLNGDAFVIEAVPASLFTPAPVATLHRLKLGPGHGIREIVALKQGFIVLAGNACAETSKTFPKSLAPGPDVGFVLHEWQPPAPPKVLLKLSALPEGAKAEGLLLLSETDAEIKLLVLCDGVRGASPQGVTLARRPPQRE